MHRRRVNTTTWLSTIDEEHTRYTPPTMPSRRAGAPNEGLKQVTTPH
ncbi:hypothetical protein HMPREF9057_02535 [Actinomyces sp. oral taxon 171 str. F0337]|nr:hypothetical protein HMPREF9057_02535 [Actinomyces sp. oral taxon 171 str. F0337]